MYPDSGYELTHAQLVCISPFSGLGMRLINGLTYIPKTTIITPVGERYCCVNYTLNGFRISLYNHPVKRSMHVDVLDNNYIWLHKLMYYAYTT